jgi:hypothetical protein
MKMIEGIILALVALIAGFSGSRWQKSRQTGITKREARVLRLQIAEAKQMAAYAIGLYEDHADVHKVLNYDLGILHQNMNVASKMIGMKFEPRIIQ